MRKTLAGLVMAGFLTLNVTASAENISYQNAYQIAHDAYIYAYPIVLGGNRFFEW